ncbi:MAG: cadmium resistance transporter [Clostridia bacterium]|nr:cadmium resistance transporter [Clostridia bacterium]
MVTLLLATVLSFIGTNIDDLFVLMLLFAGAEYKKEKIALLIGRYLGTALILAISLLGAFGLSFLPEGYLGWLGLIPLLLGIKEGIFYLRSRGKEEDDAPTVRSGSHLWAAALVTVSGGADNIGVYIPLFTGYEPWELTVFATVFAVLTALFCLFADGLVSLPRIKGLLQRHKGILVPVVYILLGVYILLEGLLL